MGKTNLIPLLTYFTVEEVLARKASAKEVGLSISNFNRKQLDYPILKQSKPKKNAKEALISSDQESISEKIKLEDEFLEILPNENALYKIFTQMNSADNNSENILETISQNESDFTQPTLF